ncbi:unnamed protein product [Vitrella brassicaformis CCMP3155]|uniref:Uncharacterized protein n=1 Tax=Vitrella brassicaformis (strain CCMP3155) TaxID=1169540 RepID=A0A0G4ELG0_VITBC|nr:unnamed protein product [Vitrella brassicaformis CCMP3155]|eukprot:CEL97844.1 unnamed protein product [Vitrella brassicaformis CCMP3155]
MHYAVLNGRVAVVNQLLEWDPKLLDAPNDDGWTPFMVAAQEGDVDVMEALYAKGGKKLLTETFNFGRTPLHCAVFNDQPAAVSQLLEWGGGALLDIVKRGGWCEPYISATPWELAHKYGKQEIIDIMKPYKRINIARNCYLFMRALGEAA